MTGSRRQDKLEDDFDFKDWGSDKHQSPLLEVSIDPEFREQHADRLLACVPTVIEVNDFDDDAVHGFEKSVGIALQANQRIIPIIIDSWGGDCYSLLRMLDLIAAVQQRGYTVATIASGKAMSCGAILLAAGSQGFRYATPDATILIHEVSSMTYGKSSEVVVEASQVQALTTRLYAILDAGCQQKSGYWEARVHANKHADLYISSAQALEAGLVNGIGLPRYRLHAHLDFQWLGP